MYTSNKNHLIYIYINTLPQKNVYFSQLETYRLDYHFSPLIFTILDSCLSIPFVGRGEEAHYIPPPLLLLPLEENY